MFPFLIFKHLLKIIRFYNLVEIALLSFSRIWGLDNKKGEATSLPLFCKRWREIIFSFLLQERLAIQQVLQQQPDHPHV